MKPILFRSIRFKLIFWYILILVFILGFSDLFLYKIFEKSLIDNIDNTLYTAAEEVQHSILLTPEIQWQQNVKKVEREFIVNRLFINIYEITGPKKNIQLVARSGILTKSISSEHVQNFLGRQSRIIPLCQSINEKSHAMHPFRIILFPLVKNSSLTHVIQVGTSLKKVFSTMTQFQMILFLLAPIILIFTSLGGYFILTKALSPVRNAVRTAKMITAEDLSLRIDSRGRRDEIGDLIETLNNMIGRLEKSVEQIKHFSTEVSHELKTPLTIIRGEIEITLRKERGKKEYKKILMSVYDEAVKLQRMVNSLLFLSQIISEESHFSTSRIQLDEILLRAFEHSVTLAREKDIRLVINQMDPSPILGEEMLLYRMIMNILENSLKYTPASGTVEITLENKKNQVMLTIKDNGIGIPREALHHVFDRFFYVNRESAQKHSGLGLGLTIVKKIVDMHQASIKIQSVVSKGTMVKIHFPIKKNARENEKTAPPD